MKTAMAVLLMSAGFSGCGGTQSPSETPPSAAPETPPAAEPAPPENGLRPDLTAEACAANGGVVVGDIGDGAIQRPDYRCPSGAPPTGNIRAPEGAPMAIEGSVCCPK
jgi:hypothetical protein